jgi:hypothetical protein
MGYIGNICQFSDNSCVKEGLSSLDGKASVDKNNNLICDYSETCGIKDDYKRDSCRLLVGTLVADDRNLDSENFLIPIRNTINNNYITIGIKDYMFSFKNTDGFNGIVFSTKPIGGDIWNGENYKINSLRLNNGNGNIIQIIGIPGSIRGIPGDEARAVYYYMPIKSKVLENIYYMTAQWKEVSGKSKIRLYVYLTMETNEGNWQD